MMSYNICYARDGEGMALQIFLSGISHHPSCLALLVKTNVDQSPPNPEVHIIPTPALCFRLPRSYYSVGKLSEFSETKICSQYVKKNSILQSIFNAFLKLAEYFLCFFLE